MLMSKNVNNDVSKDSPVTLPRFFFPLISSLYFGINTRWDSLFVFSTSKILAGVIYDLFFIASCCFYS